MCPGVSCGILGCPGVIRLTPLKMTNKLGKLYHDLYKNIYGDAVLSEI